MPGVNAVFCIENYYIIRQSLYKMKHWLIKMGFSKRMLSSVHTNAAWAVPTVALGSLLVFAVKSGAAKSKSNEVRGQTELPASSTVPPRCRPLRCIGHKLRRCWEVY